MRFVINNSYLLTILMGYLFVGICLKRTKLTYLTYYIATR
jgi:hypothetical protein